MNEVDTEKWGLTGEHPCTLNAKHGTICKFKEKGDTIELFCTNPNGCGYIIEETGVFRREGTILVGKSLLSPEGFITHRTERIPLSFWNSLRYLTCCVNPEDPSKWRTNARNLPKEGVV